MGQSLFEQAITRVTGLSIDEIGTTPLMELRARPEAKHGWLADRCLGFGHGFILPDGRDRRLDGPLKRG